MLLMSSANRNFSHPFPGVKDRGRGWVGSAVGRNALDLGSNHTDASLLGDPTGETPFACLLFVTKRSISNSGKVRGGVSGEAIWRIGAQDDAGGRALTTTIVRLLRRPQQRGATRSDHSWASC